MDFSIEWSQRTSQNVSGIREGVKILQCMQEQDCDFPDATCLEVFAEHILSECPENEFTFLAAISSTNHRSLEIWDTAGIQINGRRRGLNDKFASVICIA